MIVSWGMNGKGVEISVVEEDLFVIQQNWESKWTSTFESRVTDETEIKRTVAPGI